MRASSILTATTALVLAQAPAQAFGLRTHLYIAEQVLVGLGADCKIAFDDQTAQVPQNVCDAVQKKPAYFMAGALGPDVFPDLVIGQNYVHPGTPDGRQAADWLEHLLANAANDEEIAFAYGEMIHAAGDIFAHTYVNNYAGDVFEIGKRWHKDVEQRHFDLEKYIDQRLPYEPKLDHLEVPSDLLVRTMVQTSYVPTNIQVDHQLVLDLISDPGAEVGKILAEKLARAAPAAHLTAMWAILLVAERAPVIAKCNEIDSVKRLTAAFRAYTAAEEAARWSAAEPQITHNGSSPRRAHCQSVELKGAEAEFAAAVAAARGIKWKDKALNEREQWWKDLSGARKRALGRYYTAYLVAVRNRDEMRAVSAIAPVWAADVRKALRAYIDTSLEAGKLMVRSSEPVPPAAHEKRSMMFPYESWRACYLPVFRGEPAAAAQLICDRVRSLGVDTGLSEATFYAGIGDTPRSLVFGYMHLKQWLDDLGFDLLLQAASIMSPSMAGLINSVHSPVRVTRTKLNQTYRHAKNGQLSFKCVSDFIDTDLGLLPPAKGVEADTDCMNRQEETEPAYFKPQEFAPIRHAVTLGKLALLDRPAVKRLGESLGGKGIETSAGDGKYSVILDMARSLDGSHQWQGRSLPMPRARARDAKPEHTAGYPIYRETAAIDIKPDSKVKARPGFPYYRSKELRRDVFAKLFPGPFEGEILKRAEYQAHHYPFRPCIEDPFRPTHTEPEREPICHTGVD